MIFSYKHRFHLLINWLCNKITVVVTVICDNSIIYGRKITDDLNECTALDTLVRGNSRYMIWLVSKKSLKGE